MHRFNLLEDEHHRNTYRQSVLFLVEPLLLVIVAIIVPLYFLWRYELLSSFGSIVIIIAVVGFLWFIRDALIWYRNCYVLTNQRLIIFDHEGLLKHAVIETPLERVLNVSFRTTGVLSALFDFGDVEVQVVGLVEPVILKHIPSPADIKDYLWEMHKRINPSPLNLRPQDIPRYSRDSAEHQAKSHHKN